MSLANPPSDPPEERFCRKEATRALLTAVTELASLRGLSLEAMENLTLQECYEMAVATYGQQLPDFWRIWHQWQQPFLAPPPGEIEM